MSKSEDIKIEEEKNPNAAITEEVLTEIDNELYSIPGEIVVKIAGSILAVLMVVLWLIFRAQG